MRRQELIKILEYYQNAINWTEKYDFGVRFDELKIKITCKGTNIIFDSYKVDMFCDINSYTYVFNLNEETLQLMLEILKYKNVDLLGYSILSVTINDAVHYVRAENKQIRLDTFGYVVLNAINDNISEDLFNATDCIFTVDSTYTTFCVKSSFLPCLMFDLFKYYEAKKFADDRIFKCDLSYKKK